MTNSESKGKKTVGAQNDVEPVSRSRTPWLDGAETRRPSPCGRFLAPKGTLEAIAQVPRLWPGPAPK